MEAMKVLVVGGAGYIGSHCVRQLEKHGHEPIVVDNLVYGHKQSLAKHIPFYETDISDEMYIRKILKEEKIEMVMHFAAYAYVGESVTDPMKYYSNNVVGTFKLLQAMLATDVKKMVFSSTCATYGVPHKLPITEDEPQKPINPYGQTKLDVENILKALAQAEGLSFAALRYFNAAGAAEDGSIGEDHKPESHLIPLAIQTALGQRPLLNVYGTDYDTPDGTCLRDYIHVDDLSRAHIATFDKLQEPGTALCYNLGTGQPTSVKEIIDAVESVSGKKVPTQEVERRAGDPPVLYADASKAEKELNWVVKFNDIGKIIETAWRWHKNNPKGYSDK